MNIYQYEDFQLLLKDLFEAQKQVDPKFSHRKFAQKAGITNPGYLNDVIKGKRKISKNAFHQICQGFEFSEKECEFFQLIVNYGQAKKVEEKQEYYKQILYRRSRSKFARLHPELHAYYTDYRYPLVRSAIECNQFRGNWDDFSQYFNPIIPTHLLKKIIRELCEWDLIHQNPQGQYLVNQNFVEPPESLNSQVRHLNHTWLEKAQEALFNTPPEERHISTMLLNVDEETLKVIQDKIQAFRKDIFETIQQCSHPNTTIQLSLAQFKHGSQEDR